MHYNVFSYLFVANNAGLFFSLEELGQFTPQQLNQTVFILPKFWIDQAATWHDDRLWGQSPLGLPDPVQKLFFALYPEWPENERIQWHHYKSLRQAAIAYLNDLPLHLIQGTPLFDEDQTRLTIQETQETIYLSDEAVRYLWWRGPKVGHSCEKSIASTELYSMPQELFPSTICLLGCGLSVAWAVDHFQSISSINAFHWKNDSIPNVPANNHIDYSKLMHFHLEDNSFTCIADNWIHQTTISDTFTCQLFDAIGFEFKIHSPTSDKKKAWNTHIANRCEWIAPKNTPKWSLLHSYSVLSYSTQRYVDQFSMYPSHFCEPTFTASFYTYFEHHHISLNSTFKTTLIKKINSLTDPLNQQDRLDLYGSIYNETTNNTNDYPLFMNLLSHAHRSLFFSSHNHDHDHDYDDINSSTLTSIKGIK